MVTHPTVLAIHLRDDGYMDGCNHYRFRIPFEELRRRVEGGYFDWAPQAQVRQWAMSNAKTKPSDYDILLLPRHRPLPAEYGKPSEDTYDSAREHFGLELEGKSHLIDMVKVLKMKQSIVLEYDDDYWTDSRDLGYAYSELLVELLGEVDAVTVSTPHLRKLVQKYSPGTPVHILPNCVNWGEWQDHQRWDVWDDSVVVALTGSETHEHDWEVLKDALPRVLKQHGNVKLLIAGYMPEYLEGLDPDRVIFQEPVSYDDYPGLIRQADIVLCPVVPDDEFNQSKSAIKAIEGLAATRTLSDGNQGGAVPITSDLYYYRRVTGGNKRGLTIPHQDTSWESAISTLVTDETMRNRLAKKGRSWAYKNRSIEQQWGQWRDVYRNIHRRKRT
jgi:glycosyltransferase involved in cell wall biosynthesis